MPRPKSDESKEDYIHRFMASSEAEHDYPDQKQRYAVALSLWEHRNVLQNAVGYSDDKPGAQLFHGRHLQTGIVRYEYITNPITGEKGVDLLLTKEALDNMRKSAEGVPLVNWQHQKVEPDWLEKGKADGVVVSSTWNGDTAWEEISFMAWDKETKANCRNGFRLSCAYKPRDGEPDIDWTPGHQAGVPYHGTIKNGQFTHLAVVPSPRYEGAVIYANSKGGLTNMILELLGMGADKPVALDKERPIVIDGKEMPVGELVNAIAALEAKKADVKGPTGELKAGSHIVVDGKKYSYEECLNALKAKDAKTEPTPIKKEEPKLEGASMTKEEMQNAIKNEASKLVNEALESLKGHAFFNAVEKLAQMRPGQEAEPARKNTETDRIKEGAKRYGKRKEEEVKA